MERVRLQQDMLTDCDYFHLFFFNSVLEDGQKQTTTNVYYEIFKRQKILN